MELQFETFTAPAHWASALINADPSGLSDDEEQEMNDFLESHDIGYVVDCTDSEIGHFEGMLCDVCEYTHQRVATC